MATQFEIDCALMSGYADKQTRSYEINWFPVPSGWVEVADAYTRNASGFEATYFKTGKQIVISFAGTNPKDMNDIVTDILLGLGSETEQIVQAAEEIMGSGLERNNGVRS